MDPNMIEVDKMDGYWSYLQSIEWKDPWLVGLILLHVIITTTALLTRKKTSFQIFLFLILLVAVYFSESINEYAAHNWHSFSRQQYVDSHGLFISTVFSIPILLNCMILIGVWLYNSTQLMAKLKIEQQEQEKLKRETQNSSTTSIVNHPRGD